MISDNPSGADNQQERPSSSNWLDRIPDDLGHWVAGFVDGEGSFNVPIRREHDRALPWRVGLSFNVSQVGPEAPTLLRSVFGVGTSEAVGTGSSTMKSPVLSCSNGGSFPSSSSSSSDHPRRGISRSFERSRSSSGEVGTCRARASRRSSC